MVKLKGIVLNIQETSEKKRDIENIVWKRCILEVRIIGLSKRSRKGELEEEFLKKIIGKKVKVTRWCAFDWHYVTGTTITLDLDEVKTFQGASY